MHACDEDYNPGKSCNFSLVFLNLYAESKKRAKLCEMPVSKGKKYYLDIVEKNSTIVFERIDA